jgi:hypothetical protein
VAHAIATWGQFENVSAPNGQTLEDIGTSSAEVTAISCSAPGFCTATGTFTQVVNHDRLFAVTQTDGVWGEYEEILGYPDTDPNLNHWTSSYAISCSSPGNCTLGGYYTSLTGYQAFVATQTDGVWGTYTDIPGLNAVITDWNGASVSTISCTSPGNCLVGGRYSSAGSYHAFVATQTDGAWGEYEDIPAPNGEHLSEASFGQTGVTSVSCLSPGNCAATGVYNDEVGSQVFAVTQTDGVWGEYEDIPGLREVNTYGDATATSLSCTSIGNCVLGGYYSLDYEETEAFVATQTDGVWGSYENIPGLNEANVGTGAEVDQVSCTSDGECTASGSYRGSSSSIAFVATQTNGVWSHYEDILGLQAIASIGDTNADQLSCSSPGNCTVSGTYWVGATYQPYVATQTNGVWGNYETIPGISGVNSDGAAFINALSCTSAGNCSVVGYYISTGHVVHTFLASSTAPIDTTTSTTTPSTTIPSRITGSTLPATGHSTNALNTALIAVTVGLGFVLIRRRVIR